MRFDDGVSHLYLAIARRAFEAADANQSRGLTLQHEILRAPLGRSRIALEQIKHEVRGLGTVEIRRPGWINLHTKQRAKPRKIVIEFSLQRLARRRNERQPLAVDQLKTSNSPAAP